MKAFLTSIGERTTKVCAWQLERLGFEVVGLDLAEPWPKKYRYFIEMAAELGEDCIRIDADVIPNQKLAQFAEKVKARVISPEHWMIQFMAYDLYKNDVGVSSPVFYRKEALEIIAKHPISEFRPEAEAWRLKEIDGIHNYTYPEIIGMHGFFQDDDTVARAMENKTLRKQNDLYDWELVKKLRTEGLI